MKNKNNQPVKNNQSVLKKFDFKRADIFKRAAITIAILTAISISFILICTASLFFYIQSDHCSQLLQSQINKRIPGKMAWTRLDIDLLDGDVTLENYNLSLNNDELIAIDKVHIDLDLSNILTANIFETSDKSANINNLDFDISNIKKQALVIKDITIEKPRIALAMTSEKRLDILSAFPPAEEKDKPEDKEKPFKMPFKVTLNKLNIIDGEFLYRSEKSLNKPESGKMFVDIKKINLLADGNIADKADVRFDYSMKLNGSDLTLQGDVKNISLSADHDSFPIFNLTSDANLATEELLKMAGEMAAVDNQKISGKISIHTALSGELNDPSFSCRINYPNGTVMGRQINSIAADIIMKKRELTIKGLEIEHPDASLKAGGHISLAQAFPQGFLMKNGGQQIDKKTPSSNDKIENSKEQPEKKIDEKKIDGIDINKITGKFNITAENIDAGRLFESENIKGIKGVSSFKLDFAGSLNNPEIKLTLRADNAGYKDYPVLDKGDFDLVLSNGVVKINKFDIASCSSTLKLDGNVRVIEPQKDGKFKLMADPLLNLEASSDKIDIAQILKSFKVLKDQQLIATLKADSKLTGTVKNPTLTLNASGDNLDLMGQKIGSASLKALYQNKKTVIDSFLVTLDSKNIIQAKGWIDQNQNQNQTNSRQKKSNSKQSPKFKLDILSNGVDLTLIESLKKSDAVKAVASGSITAEGSFDSIKSSKVDADISLKQVTLMNKPFQDFSAKLSLKDNQLNLNGQLNFDVAGNFDFKSKNFAVQAVFNKTELLPWLTFAEVKAVESGTISGNVDIKGNADNLNRISGRCSLKELSLNLFNDPAIFADSSEPQNTDNLKSTNKNKKMVVKAENITALIDGKSFKIERFKTTLPEDGEVVLAGSGRIGGDIKAQADAVLPVKFISLFVKQMPDIRGVVRLNLMADIKSDNIKGSDLDATVEFIDIAVTVPVKSGDGVASIVKINEINGTIKADVNQVRVNQITGRVSDGRLKGAKSGSFKLTGDTKLVNFMPEDINLALNAQELPINMIEDLTGSLDADLKFKGSLKSSTILWGSVWINHGDWRGDIHVEKKLLSKITDKKRVRKEVKLAKEANQFLENMQLNIAVKGRKPFIVDNNLAYMEIHPDIRIRGTAASPLVSGRSKIEPGTINYQSTEFELTRGIIDFVNPYKIEPELDIESHRTVRDWDILLSVSGTPDNIIFKLSSEPRLEDGDIISLLIRGKTVTELIDAEGGTTFSAAGMLSQVAASAVGDKFKSATGLDIFEVGFNNKSGSSSNSNDSELGNLNVTVGKELTDRITVKYGTANEDGIMVSTTSAQYKVTDSISVSGFQDSEGQFGGEVRYRLEFR